MRKQVQDPGLNFKLMKKVVVMAFSLFLSVSSFAQENPVNGKTFWDDPFNHSMLPLYLVSALILIVMILIAFVAIYMIKILNLLTTQAEQEKAKKLGITYVSKPTWWIRFSQTMNASVPLEQEKTIELDHSYDGIKELDNHLPPWWKWLFYGTIGWGAVYIFVFHISKSFPLQSDEYQTEVTLAEEQVRKLRASQPVQEIDENSLVFMPDSTAFITNGKVVFMDNNCGSCHRADGGGNTIGPNLTDEYWLHGGHIKNVFSTIRNGAVEKGMPAWGKSLSPQEVRDVTFFVLSLQGTYPANAKNPQGEIYKEVVVQSDSLKVQASL
jgi:cytochrome c oxidase cbb3-type subunit III